MKSTRTPVGNQLIKDMEPQDIFRRLAQMQPQHFKIWKGAFRHWHRKNRAGQSTV